VIDIVYISNIIHRQRVEAAKQSHWINTLLYPPYLTQSPAGVFLLTYYPDAVGMSATECLPTESCKFFNSSDH